MDGCTVFVSDSEVLPDVWEEVRARAEASDRRLNYFDLATYEKSRDVDGENAVNLSGIEWRAPRPRRRASPAMCQVKL